MYEAALASLINVSHNYLNAGFVGKRLGNNHPNIVPYGYLEFLWKFRVYEAKGGKHIVIGCAMNS